MCSSDAVAPWRLCPRCRAHGPGIAELGWLPVGVRRPGRTDLSGPGHVYTCRYCGHAWMGIRRGRSPGPPACDAG